MKTFLLSIFALAIVAAPVMGEEDQDHPKPPKNNRSQNPPPQRQVNPAPRNVVPRVQNNVAPKPQFQPQNRPPVTARTYAPPKSYTPEVQARLRNNAQNTQRFTPPNQDMPRTNGPTVKTDVNNRNWRNRPRTDPNVINPQTPTTNVAPNTTARNRNWQNRNNNNNNNNSSNTNRNRNWQNNNNAGGTFTFDQARQRHHRDRHDRSWWRSRYNRIALFAGGYYFWDNNYWYPAYGYDPYYSNYSYDEPIYGYNDLQPGQVIANVQSALQEQGYYNDEVDGLIGPNTRAALSNFQRDQGLPVTAAIDGPTLQALGLN
jgi:hypothetical protein